MAEPEARFRLVADSRKAEGTAAGMTVFADRPEGRAGGTGAGYNGGQLLALSLGACYSNDLQYVAEEMGLSIKDFALEIFITWGGTPMMAKRIRMTADVELSDGSDPSPLIEEAARRCAISNTLKAGTSVTIEDAAKG